MIVLHARIPIRPDMRDTFLGAVSGLVEASNAEPGVISYECFESAKTENSFIFVEEYTDQAALDSHMASEHFQAAAGGLGDMVSGPPELKVYETSEPKLLNLG